MVYTFKPGSPFAGDPQIVGTELEYIRERTGVLTAQEVVRAASSPDSYLHQYFTWDDTKAAVKFREHQARVLICAVAVTKVDEKPCSPVRAFVSIGPKSDRYQPIVKVLSQEQLRQELLNKALKELSWFKQKYATLSELSSVFAAIDSVSSLAA